MAFGDSSALLDDFNRANAETLGADWTTGWVSGAANSQDIVSNQAGEDGQFMFASDYYDVATYGADVEAYITIVSIGDNVDDGFIFGARLVDPGATTTDGYYIYLDFQSGNDNISIRRRDNGSGTVLGATITSDDFSAGDKLGLECDGDQISAYRYVSSWSSLGSRTDDTYDSAGYIGIGTYRAGTTQLLMDDLYGGTISAGNEYYQSAAGVLTPVGIIIKSGRKNLAGFSTFVGSISKSTTKTFAGTSTMVGSLIKQAQKAFTGSLTVSGVLGTIKSALLSIGGSLTPSGILVKQTGKILSGSLTATGLIVKQVAKAFIGSITAVGSLATQKITGGYFQVVGGAVTMAGILVKQTNKQTAGIITAAGILARQISKAFTGATTAAGSLVRQTAKSFVGSVTAVGTLASQLTFIQIVSGAVTMVGSLVRMTGKQSAGILTMAGGITKQITKTFTGVLTAVGALARQALGLPVPDSRIYAIAAEVRIYSIPG